MCTHTLCTYCVRTIWFHADVETLLVATELADVARCRGDLTVALATALVLGHVAFLHRAPEETLVTNDNDDITALQLRQR